MHPTAEDQANYKTFFLAMGRTLPCPTCRANFESHLRAHPIESHLDSKSRLFDWTVAMHNAVNAAKGRRQWTSREAYESLRHRFGGSHAYLPDWKVTGAVAVALAVLAVIVLRRRTAIVHY